MTRPCPAGTNTASRFSSKRRNSAVTGTPSARDRSTIEEMTAPLLVSVSMRLTKERSIFSFWNEKSMRKLRLE